MLQHRASQILGQTRRFASFSAAQWLAPYGRTGTHYFFADEEGLRKLRAALKLAPASKGENVVVTVPKDAALLADLIALVAGVDGILQAQAGSDAAYFLRQTGMADDTARAASVGATLLKAYRWQYVVSGALELRFQEILGSLIDETQMQRVLDALTPLMYARPLAMQRAMS